MKPITRIEVRALRASMGNPLGQGMTGMIPIAKIDAQMNPRTVVPRAPKIGLFPKYGPSGFRF